MVGAEGKKEKAQNLTFKIHNKGVLFFSFLMKMIALI